MAGTVAPLPASIGILSR